MRRGKTRRGGRSAAAFLAFAACVAAYAQEGGESSAGTPALLEFSSREPRLSNDSDVADWVAGKLHARLGLADTDRLVVADAPRLVNGRAIFRIAQASADLPVAYEESRLILDGERRPLSLLGGHTPFPHPPGSRPTLDSGRAMEAARASDPSKTSARLVFWPDDGKLRLSYEIEGMVRKGDDAAVERLHIDARDGAVLERLPLTWDGRDRRVYDVAAACQEAHASGWLEAARQEASMLLGAAVPLGIVHPARFPHVLVVAADKYVRNEASPRYPGASAERLFAMLGEYYRFLRVTLDMDSFDNRGSALQAFVNIRFHDEIPGMHCVGSAFNAQWRSDLETAFIPAAALRYSEIIGHEIGHGVIGAGSGLIYAEQSGALNEALADAFGVAFRAWLDSGGGGVPQRISGDGWQMRGPDGVSRDMRRPGRLESPINGSRYYPDHFDDFLDTREDNGGVHINSSIVNQAFYLLAMGGRHPQRRSGPVVQGIGLRKAIGIYGLAASDLLTPRAGFKAARYAFAQAAEIRHGKSSDEWVAVHTAMDAVGIPGNWRLPAPPAPAPTRTPPPAPPPSPAPPPPTRTPAPSPPTTPPPTRTPAPSPAPTPSPSPAPPPPTKTPAPSPPTRTPAPPKPPPASVPGNATSLPLVWVGAAAVLLAALGGMLFKFRPDGGRANRDAPAAVAATGAPPAAPPPAAAPARTAGFLVPAAGATPIPLRSDLLASAEGLVIGRSAELCHVRIRDPQVSRRHLRLRLAGGTLLMEDLNSTRGTQVDADPAPPFQPVPLRAGQTLHIAALPYRFDSPPTAARRPREDDRPKM